MSDGWKSWPIAWANRASEPMESDDPRTAALSMIARWDDGSWSMRAAMRARSEPGSADPAPHVAASAASSTRNSGLPPPRSTSSAIVRSLGSTPSPRSRIPRTRSLLSVGPSGPSGTCSTSGRSTGGGHAMSPSGRWPVTSRNGRSDSERTTTASWSRSDGSAHCRLSTQSTVMRVWA